MIYSNVELSEQSVYNFANVVLDTQSTGIKLGVHEGQIEFCSGRSFVHSDENLESNYVLLRVSSLHKSCKLWKLFMCTARENREFIRYSVEQSVDYVEYLVEVCKDKNLAFCVPDGKSFRVVLCVNNWISTYSIDKYVDRVSKGELPNLLEVIWKHDVLAPSRDCVSIEPMQLKKPNPKSPESKYISTYLKSPGLIKTLECPEEIREHVFTKMLNYIYNRGYFYLYLDEESIEIIGLELIREVFMGRYKVDEQPLRKVDEDFMEKYVK